MLLLSFATAQHGSSTTNPAAIENRFTANQTDGLLKRADEPRSRYAEGLEYQIPSEPNPLDTAWYKWNPYLREWLKLLEDAQTLFKNGRPTYKIPPVFWKCFKVNRGRMDREKNAGTAGNIFRSIMTDDTLKINEDTLLTGINTIVKYNEVNFPPRFSVQVTENGQKIGNLWFEVPIYMPSEDEMEAMKNDETWPQYEDSIFGLKVDTSTGLSVDEALPPALQPSTYSSTAPNRARSSYLLTTPDYSFVIPDTCEDDTEWQKSPGALRAAIERGIYELRFPTDIHQEIIHSTAETMLVRGFPLPTFNNLYNDNRHSPDKRAQFGDWLLDLQALSAASDRPCVDIMSRSSPNEKYGHIELYPAERYGTPPSYVQVVGLEWPMAGDFSWPQSRWPHQAAWDILHFEYAGGGQRQLEGQPAIAYSNELGEVPGQPWQYRFDVLLYKDGLTQQDVSRAFQAASSTRGKSSYDLVSWGETLGTIHIRCEGDFC